MLAKIEINHSEAGLTEKKAAEISAFFKPMLDKMEELEDEFNRVSSLPISPETCKEAKVLRGKYRDVRIGTATIHKEQKAYFLAAGRVVDGWKNAQLLASNGYEEKLLSIEKHYENIEKERIAALQAERESLLLPFDVDVIPQNLGTMEDVIWDVFYTGTRANYENRKEAERIAEENRIAEEKAEAEERERIRKENEKLKAEAAAREAQIKAETEAREKDAAIERARAAKIEAERNAKIEAERKAHEDALRIERERVAKIEAENAERIKAETEARELELSKGDSEKVADLVNEIASIKTRYYFESSANKKMYTEVCILLDKVLAHIGPVLSNVDFPM